MTSKTGNEMIEECSDEFFDNWNHPDWWEEKSTGNDIQELDNTVRKALTLLAEKMQEEFIERETNAFAKGVEKGAEKMQSDFIESHKWYKQQYDKAFGYGIEQGKKIKARQDKVIIKDINKLRKDNKILVELNSNQSKLLEQENKDFSLALKEFEEEIDNWQSNVWNRKLRGVIGVFCWGDILRELKQLLHSKLGEFMEDLK